MITISRVKQATTEFIKILRFGKNDIQTADNVQPFGVDSKPVMDLQAVHSTTQNDEKSVILGYIQKSEKTESGEIRIYSTDKNNSEKFYIILKKNGTAEIGGSTDFMVRYNALNSGLQAFVNTLNANLATAFTSVGGTWDPATLDISNSKINEVKVL